MKKKVLILILGLLLVGVNVYAAGDLIVNGQLSVGTGTPMAKHHVVANDIAQAIKAEVYLSDTNPGAGTNIGAYYNVNAAQTGMTTFNAYVGFQGQVGLTGDGTAYGLIGAENVVYFGSSAPSTITYGKGNTAVLRRAFGNSANHDLENYYGFHSYGGVSGSGNISGTDWRHAYFENFPDFGGTRTNVTGLWIDQQTRGTNNYGLVLDGEDNGADIVFGNSQEARIYATQFGGQTRLYAQDGSGNATILSPHDPETGEWIYYSKNIKTGRTVRVNMEKLVKAVEKITGETFMVETLMEE